MIRCHSLVQCEYGIYDRDGRSDEVIYKFDNQTFGRVAPLDEGISCIAEWFAVVNRIHQDQLLDMARSLAALRCHS
jgi:hypothetical protein